MDVDVAIVGAGIVGLHAAYELRQSGLSVAVYEARQIGRQATGRSTAKVSSQHGLKYGSLIRDFGRDKAKLYADANLAAIMKIATIGSSLPENAGLEEKPAYLYAESAQQRDRIEAEAKVASSLGLPAQLLPSAHLPFETHGALRFVGQYQFDPYLCISGLAQLVAEAGIQVFERRLFIEHANPGCRLESIPRGGANGCSIPARLVTGEPGVGREQRPQLVARNGGFR